MQVLYRTTRVTLSAALLIGLGACQAGEGSGGTGPGPELPGAEATDGGEAALVNSWSTRMRLPTGVKGLVAASVNGSVYAIGGEGFSPLPGYPVPYVHRYVPSGWLRLWTSRASMPEGRSYAAATVIGGKIYVAGGVGSGDFVTRTLFVYNPNSNTWVRKADLPILSAWGASGAIDGKLYVFTPRIHDSPPRLHRYDPATDSWIQLAGPPHDHRQPVAGVIDGKLYLAGGADPANQKTETDVLDVYDPVTNTWVTRKPMPTPRVGAAGAILGARLYVIGGRSGSLTLEAVEAYNPTTDTWVTKAPIPTERRDLAVTRADGKLFALGGVDEGSALRTNEAYTP